MTSRKDYSGEFDPGFRYEDLSKEALVRLVREYALIPQILDRSGLAAVGLRYGQKAVEEIAIEEWRGASPIYTERISKIMKIEGNGVSAIFKALQLDPGFVFSYMDVEYELISETHGFFQLRSCGALLDVEPFGERSITGMCHTIEDGTFDWTAQAVNPRARIRPVHRPPRVPAGRVPHCRWEVIIDDETEPVGEAEITRMTRGTTAARHHFPPLRDGTPTFPPDPPSLAECVPQSLRRSGGGLQRHLPGRCRVRRGRSPGRVGAGRRLDADLRLPCPYGSSRARPLTLPEHFWGVSQPYMKCDAVAEIRTQT